MAITGATLTSLDAALKYDYLPVIREQVTKRNALYARLRRNTEDFYGKEAYMVHHTGRNVGISARAENGALGAAGKQAYAKITFPTKYNYARISLTGQTIKACKNRMGAYLKALESETKGAARDLKRDISRQLMYGGTTGALTTCGVTDDSTTVVVDTTKFLQVGMIVDIATTSTGVAITNGDSVTVATIPSSTTFTVATAVTTAATHSVYREDNYNNEITGIDVAIDSTGTYLGLNRATAGNEYWKAQQIDNNGTPTALTLDLMQQACDLCEQQDGEISIILTNHAVRRKYLALLQAKQEIVNKMKLDFGFTAIGYNGIPVVADPDLWPGGRMYFIDEDTFSLYELSQIEWADEDGHILKWVTGYDGYEALLVYYSELGCEAPRKNCVLEDITE